jgi:hypothetical protein
MERENKQQRFKRVAERRVQNILKSIRSLSQCANAKIYEWDDGQLKKIWRAIDLELKACRESFDNPDAGVFRL